MAMDDSTPYGYEEYEEYNWKATAKKFGKIAIMLLLIGAVGYVIYDFLIGSTVTVEFSVLNTEKKGITDSSISVEDESGAVVLSPDGLSSYTLKLKRGLLGAPKTYIVRASADGYKSKNTEIIVQNDGALNEVKLVKDIDVEILGIWMPPQLFGNQEFDMIVEVANEGSSGEEIEFKFSGEFEEYGCRAVDNPVYVMGGAVQDFNVECTVPSVTGLERSTKGAPRDGSISIKYTTSSEKKEFMLFPEPSLIIGASVNFYGLHPTDEPKKKEDLLLQNRSTFPIYNVRLRIEITSAEKNGAENVKDWVYFTNANPATRDEMLVELIDSKEKYKEFIEVNIPPTAIEEEIFGSIIVEAPFLEAPRKADLSIKISGSAEAELSYDIPSIVSISFSDGEAQDKIDSIELENNGNLDIENIDLYIKDSDDCTSRWLDFTTSASIPEIKAGESHDVTITLSAPPSADVGDYRACILMVSYIHPLTGDIVSREAGVLQVKRTG